MVGSLAGTSRQFERRFGDIVLRTAERRLAGPLGSALIEPKVVEVLGILGEAAGAMVRRDELFVRCWGNAAAGDDSLNRSVYQLRKALQAIGSQAVSVETVAAAGYILQVVDSPLAAACDSARRSWRMGHAGIDQHALSSLEAAIAEHGPATADAWGQLALLQCRAAEYAPLDQCIELARQCEAAGRTALGIDPLQPDAQVALASLCPLYGDWSGRRTRLLDVLAETPDHFPARHELAVLEMATGRVSAAVPIIAALFEEDPFAPLLHYKRGYHLYCLGEHDAMDRVFDNGLQVWPGHPGLWQGRSMTLAFTGRAAAALALLDDVPMRPAMPPETIAFHRLALTALANNDRELIARSVSDLHQLAGWQSLAAAAIMYLSALGDCDHAMKLCEGYYLRDGNAPVRLRYEPGIEASINDMHRRATQLLFLPVTESLREHPRFMRLCERMGLVEYWNFAAVQPDFLG